MVAAEMSGSFDVAGRLYGIALRLLPRELRDRYGDDMRQTFADRAAGRHGLGVGMLFVEEFVDLVRARHRPVSRCRQRRHPVGSLTHDIRYALRLLYRQPSFTIVAVITLALGIGATTAVFTVVNGVLLRPLPYREPDRLVQLFNGRNGRLSVSYSPPNYRDVTTGSGVFAGATAITPSSANLIGNGDPQQLDGANVTTSFFTVLGATPQRGRAFADADGTEGAPAVVVVSDGLWRRQFGARSDIVGSTLRLDGKPFTVIGVAPPDLTIPAGAEYWRPLIFSSDNLSDKQRGAQWVGAIARLKPGVTLEQANGAMAIVARRLSEQYPNTNKDRVMTAMRLHDRIVRGIRPALLILLGAVTLVLLVACVNVANLLLARANSRAREVAVRAAVGAGRARLIQQFLAESVVLGAAGAAAGLAVAYWAIRALVALGPSRIPRLAEVGFDWRVLMFVVTVAMATSIVFGLVPALATTGRSFARLISTAGRGLVGEAGPRLRRTLVVAEMALAVVLLVAAGLLMRSYQRISHVDPGFSPDHVLTFAIGLPESKYKTSAEASGFVQAFVDSLAARPGVEAAAGVFGLPLDDNFSASSSFTRPGEADSADSPSVGMRIVTPDYFKALRIPLRGGRLFDGHDDETGAEVVVINEEAARRYWPGMNPIGQQLHLGVRLAEARSGQKTIVGVVGDVKKNGLDATPAPEVYLPHKQHAVDSLTIVVRTAGEPAAFVSVARADLANLDRELPISAVRTMDEVVGRSIVERRFMMVLLGTFAAVAILLAAIGVYGVLAYIVSQRTQEIGVRLAIGASPADVVRLFLREGVALAASGLLIGVVSALAAGRVLASLLFGVTTTDPLTFVGVTLALGIAAFCASYLPARRAAAVDPMTALRTD
jgi:putative ABC transport system permease protein